MFPMLFYTNLVFLMKAEKNETDEILVELKH